MTTQIDRYTGLREAARAVINDRTDEAIDRLARALEAAPTFTDPYPKKGESVAEDIRNILQVFKSAERHEWRNNDHVLEGYINVQDLNGVVALLEGALAKLEPPKAAQATPEFQAEAARLQKIGEASEALMALVPAKIGDWHMGGDLSGAIHWTRDDVRAVVYATPNWEGLEFTPVALIVDDNPDQIDLPSLPLDATQYDGRWPDGAAEYVRLLTPVLEETARKYPTPKGEAMPPTRERNPAFFATIDGDTRLPFYPWPEAGCFLAVLQDRGERAVLFSCPMWADGTPDMDNIADVENIEGLDLAQVNRFFQTDFEPSEFAGR